MPAGKLLIFSAVVCLSACQHNKSIISVGYQDGGNLQIGDKVLLDGIAVGEVVKFHFVPRMVLVDLSMEEDVKIPLKSRFIISKSLLGSVQLV
jgi:ABC-type transporter Mla subunit MlaD